MTDPDDTPGPVILSCGHRWGPGDADPVMQHHVVPLGDGWGVMAGSVREACALRARLRDRAGYAEEAEAWAEVGRRKG